MAVVEMKDAARIADPLRDSDPGENLPHYRSYWLDQAGSGPQDDGALHKDVEVDVAIIGGGYTGLSSAFHLAKAHGILPVVLEANQVGWGCSGRNGGFARPAIGRVAYADWIGRWGVDESRKMFAEALSALDTVSGLIDEGGIDCDRQPDGHLKLAHRPGLAEALRREVELLSKTFGFSADFLTPGQIAEQHFRGNEAFGAIRWPVSFAVNPLKLTHGLLRMARDAGVRVHSGSPVLEWSKASGRHVLRTPHGVVRAGRVIMATNGYTFEAIFPDLRARLLPVMSNIVVSQPLSSAEIDEGNFVTTDVMSDCRKMLYYFRRLPDNRIMMGGKGPVWPRAVNMNAHREHLIEVIRRKFPFVKAPRADYFWGGWVALTLDSVPHIGKCEDDPSIYYSLGYIGSGVSFSIHAGRRLAEWIATGSLAVPGPVAAPLKSYPFAAFRRVGQWAMMKYYGFKD